MFEFDLGKVFLLIAFFILLSGIGRNFTFVNSERKKEKEKKLQIQKAKEKVEEEKQKEEIKLSKDNVDEHISLYLIETGRISPEMCCEELRKAYNDFLDETNELSMKKILEEIREEEKAKQNGTYKIEFDKAMYLLRHYNRRSLISEDGKVFIGGVKNENQNEEKSSVYISIEDSKKPIEKILEEAPTQPSLENENFLYEKNAGLSFFRTTLAFIFFPFLSVTLSIKKI